MPRPALRPLRVAILPHAARPVLLALCLLLASCTVAGTSAPRQSRRPPNVLLIVADDLGFGELSCYGQRIIKTPAIDRLAREGVRFTAGYAAAPVCAPSRASMLTGLHAGHSPIRDNRELKPEGQQPLPAGTVTLAGLLRDRGYATALVGKWGLGMPGSEGDPLRHGFDFFYGYHCQRHAHNHYPTFLRRNDAVEHLEGNTPGNRVGAVYAPDRFLDETEAFIRGSADRPFFVMFATTVPHAALQVPEDSLRPWVGAIEDAPYDGRQGYLPHPAPHAAYAAMVSRLDRDVGRLLDLLDELEVADDTLVVFTSDNGPTHGRVGGADSAFFESAAGLRGLKGSLHEGGIRVPLLARLPGVTARNATVDHPVSHIDLMPTILDLAGPSSDDAERRVDGVSLVGLLSEGRAPTRATPLYWEFPGYGGQQAVRMGDLKAIRKDLSRGGGHLELYDLATDPAESRDLADSMPEEVGRARSMMRESRTRSATFPFPSLDR